MADSNKYRWGTGTKYKNSALSVKEVTAFLSKYNKLGERTCRLCAKKFNSEGAHNRTCDKCKGKQENKYQNKKTRELIEYKAHFLSGKIATAFRGETD